MGAGIHRVLIWRMKIFGQAFQNTTAVASYTLQWPRDYENKRWIKLSAFALLNLHFYTGAIRLRSSPCSELKNWYFAIKTRPPHAIFSDSVICFTQAIICILHRYLATGSGHTRTLPSVGSLATGLSSFFSANFSGISVAVSLFTEVYQGAALLDYPLHPLHNTYSSELLRIYFQLPLLSLYTIYKILMSHLPCIKTALNFIAAQIS